MRHAATMLSRSVKTATLTSILCLAPLVIDVRSAWADVVLQGDTLIVIGTSDDDELYIIGVDGHSGIMTV